MFTVSVRDNYKGKKPVTQWLKYHIKAKNWKEGIDYIMRVRHGLPDALLTETNANVCGLFRRAVITPADNKTARFVYVVRVGDEYKIGVTSDPKQRANQLDGDWIDLVMCSNAVYVEGKAHKAFESFNTHGEYYSLDLPLDEVWYLLRFHAVR